MDYVNTVFSLAIGLEVVRGSHLELNLKVFISCCQRCEVNQLSLLETIESGYP
jgi:hypothetical protein